MGRNENIANEAILPNDRKERSIINIEVFMRFMRKAELSVGS